MEDQSIKKSTVVTSVVAILLILVGTLVYVKYIKPNNDVTPTGQVQGETEEKMTITAKHQFKNGKHIIAGDIDLPTPCYVLDSKVNVAESAPEQVTLVFTATTQGEVCAQVITTERFKLEFQASEQANISATWNGKPATLNLIPAGANEDLNNFELFIKG